MTGAGALAADAPADPAALPSMPSFGWAVVQMFVVLGAIIAALLLVAKVLLPRLSQRPLLGGSGKLIQVVDTTRLEPGKSVYLIRVDQQYFLVGTSENNIRTLAGGELDTTLIERALADRGPEDASGPKSTYGGSGRRTSFVQVLRGRG